MHASKQPELEVSVSHSLPFITSVPIPEVTIKTGAKINKIKILSWDLIEDKRDTRISDEEVADHLVAAISENDPDFINLQGLKPRSELLKVILRKLPPKYKALTLPAYENIIVDINGCVSIYDQTKIKSDLADNKDTINSLDKLSIPEFNGNVGLFRFRSLNKTVYIRLLNVDEKNIATSVPLETRLKNFLTTSNEENILPTRFWSETVNVVSGSFNATIAPVDIIQRAILTGFSDNDGFQLNQGAFYSTENKNKIEYHQSEIKILNATTGKAIDTSVISNEEMKEWSEKQKENILQYRKIFDFDPSFATEQLSNGLTISELEAQLQNELQDNPQQSKIEVKWGRNLNNQMGVFIWLPSDIEYWVWCHNLKNKNYQFNSQDSDDKHWVAVNNFDLDQLLFSIKLANFYRKIIMLENKRFDEDGIKLFKTLHNQLNKQLLNKPNSFRERGSPYPVILNHFDEVVGNLIHNPRPTFDDIDRSAKSLDVKLHGKKPMNTLYRGIIGGIIGGLTGLVLGLAVGFALTFYAGGFAAIPTGIAFAFKGAAIGAGAGGFCGFLGGLFHGKNKQKEYIEMNTIKDNSMNPDIYNTCGDIFEKLVPKI